MFWIDSRLEPRFCEPREVSLFQRTIEDGARNVSNLTYVNLGESITCKIGTLKRPGHWVAGGKGELSAIEYGQAEQGLSILPNRKAVFVVDDDVATLRGLRRLLKQHGFDAVLFDSAEALRHHDHFDQAFCIILDINLNDESGIEVRHRLAEAGISLPIIFITGNDNHATRMAAMESGCLAYLTKPFSARSLMDPIEKASASLM